MKVKRILSALLTLSLLLSCICIFASAESESYTGVYKGYNYYTSTAATKSSIRAYLSYADTSAKLMIDVSYNYKNTSGVTKTDNFLVTGKSSALGTKMPSEFKEFVSLTPSYYINGTFIQKVSVGA